MKNKLAMAGLIILFLIVVAIIFAPLLTNQPPTKSNLLLIEQPPSADHPLGTDSSGRDNFFPVFYMVDEFL